MNRNIHTGVSPVKHKTFLGLGGGPLPGWDTNDSKNVFNGAIYKILM